MISFHFNEIQEEEKTTTNTKSFVSAFCFKANIFVFRIILI